MNSELNFLTKLIILFNALALLIVPIAKANPAPATATVVESPSLIKDMGFQNEPGPVWCYNTEANAALITAKQIEVERCKLKLQQQEERLTATHSFELDTLKIELDSINKQYKEILLIKDKEIENLTKAALKRPNDYSLWWASGGFATGVALVLGILWAVK
tara:strand:+ start:5383 stop:5865 length:483 start_codon:yes stop_codon:yes gene_type:complete